MDTKSLIVAAVIGVIGLGAGYYLGTSSVSPQAGMHMMPGGGMMKDNRMGGAADQHFIDEMIPHHQGAIDMAKVALEKSKRPEILQLARDIIAAQQKEIDDMIAWHESWYGTLPAAGGVAGMHMAGMTGDLSVLKAKSGDDFDKEFLTQMIPHDEMAIMMAQMIRSSDRPEMRELAENIVTSQAREISMMRGWLSVWFK